VFLVDDDEPQIACGRKDGRPGPHDNLRFTPFDFSPLIVAHRRADPAVQDGDLACRKAAFHPADELGRQGDLRHEIDGAPPLAENFGDGADVDFRLSASGHPVKQQGREGARGDAVENGPRAASCSALSFKGLYARPISPGLSGFSGFLLHRG